MDTKRRGIPTKLAGIAWLGKSILTFPARRANFTWYFFVVGVASIFLLAMVCSSSCRKNVVETSQALWQRLNLPLPRDLTSHLTSASDEEGMTTTLSRLWRNLSSRLPSLSNISITRLLHLPSLTIPSIPSMPAMFTMRIDHYAHMPGFPNLPQLDSPTLVSVILIFLLLTLLTWTFVVKPAKVSHHKT